MALTQVYSANAGDTITAARWNNEFGNIYNNGTDVGFPITKAVSFAGWTITWDASGNTTMISSASQSLQYTPGAKTGTPSTTGSVLNVVASTYTDNNTAGSGTAAAWAGVAIQRPTLAASNTNVTTTDAATLYIANSPAEGTNDTITNEWALWVDAGNVRFDGILVCPSVFSTGDVKLTLKTTADSGWVLMNDTTIGNGSSGASGRANADTVDLFTLLWANTADADCAVSSGRGASAAADYAANKTIALPKALGRALATYGAGSGLTSRALAKIVGEETHVITTAELPAHNHSISLGGDLIAGTSISQGTSDTTDGSVNTENTGSGTAANVMQPTVFLNVMIKL